MYHLHTCHYLRRFKGYFKTRGAAIDKVKEILDLSFAEHESKCGPLALAQTKRSIIENLAASVCLTKLDNISFEDLSTVFLKQDMCKIAMYDKELLDQEKARVNDSKKKKALVIYGR